jgi:transcriptional antiterminator RfaH
MAMARIETATAAPLAQQTGPAAGAGYVAQTLPRKEEVARQNLARQRFASFLPRYKVTRQHARQRYDVLTPLFPGYIFVRFNPEEAPWRSINGTMGVLGLVGPRLARPVPMPANAIDNIMARCRNGIMTSLLECLEPGAVMRVISGPFADQLVTIEALDGRERVRVLLNILGADQRFDLACDCLGPA